MKDVSRFYLLGYKLICTWVIREICLWCNLVKLPFWVYWTSGTCRNISVLHMPMLWKMWRKSSQLLKASCYESMFDWISCVWNYGLSCWFRYRACRNHLVL